MLCHGAAAPHPPPLHFSSLQQTLARHAQRIIALLMCRRLACTPTARTQASPELRLTFARELARRVAEHQEKQQQAAAEQDEGGKAPKKALWQNVFDIPLSCNPPGADVSTLWVAGDAGPGEAFEGQGSDPPVTLRPRVGRNAGRRLGPAKPCLCLYLLVPAGPTYLILLCSERAPRRQAPPVIHVTQVAEFLQFTREQALALAGLDDGTDPDAQQPDPFNFFGGDDEDEEDEEDDAEEGEEDGGVAVEGGPDDGGDDDGDVVDVTVNKP